MQTILCVGVLYQVRDNVITVALIFAFFVEDIKVLKLRQTFSGQWQQLIYTLLIQLILIIPSIRSISSAPARRPAPLRLVMPFLLRHFRSHQSTTCYLSPEYRESSGAALDLQNDGALQVCMKCSR